MSKGKSPIIVTAELILANAEPEDSPLHEAFDWSDRTEAGHFRRLLQVEEIFENIMVSIDGAEPVQGFVRATNADGWVKNPAAGGD
jgi:hypothetical protein